MAARSDTSVPTALLVNTPPRAVFVSRDANSAPMVAAVSSRLVSAAAIMTGSAADSQRRPAATATASRHAPPSGAAASACSPRT